MKPKTPSPPHPLIPSGLNEAHLQQLIVEGLRWLGYTVLVTSRRRGRGPDGADPGVPDLLVTRRGWPNGLWLGLEVKGPRTRLSADQQALHLQGRIVVVRSFDVARLVVEQFERTLRK